MSGREALAARPDVAEGDIDDIIGIASELQQADRDAAERPTADDVKAVASELDIDPAYIDAAIAELGRRRTERARVDRLVTLQAAETRRRLTVGALVVCAVVALLFGGQVAVAWSASRDLSAARANLEATATYVEVVLDRQAALVPQLVALGGGDPAAVQVAANELSQGGAIDVRLEASRKLDQELSAVLADLPPPRDETEATQRLGLTHELSGIQSRRSTELQRLADARRQWEVATSRPGAGFALRLGLATGPDPALLRR
ncbi:MAG: hypothetical protein KC621_19855 [Myxococcales bacterium]|nr:hypothetical protein [Myxococcales bacterium]